MCHWSSEADKSLAAKAFKIQRVFLPSVSLVIRGYAGLITIKITPKSTHFKDLRAKSLIDPQNWITGERR